MSQKELLTESREPRGKVAARQMRRAGKLPAVLYGHGQDPISLSVNAKEFSDLIAHSGTHMLLNLKGASNETAVIKKIERHPVKGIPATIDFLRVSANERITAKVADIFGLNAGESTAFIRCDLLQGSGNDWGHKPLEEAMHPYYYSCPLRYLDMAPEQCRDWRDGVRAHHARRNARKSVAMTG